jgi:sucrose-6-phosphate hydrolase SacC (GH32 family)
LALFAVPQFAQAEKLWEKGWQKSNANPILSLSPKGAFDSHNIFAPAIVKHNGTYYLYYSGGPSGERTGEELVNYQLGVATSTDGVHFTKHGKPLLPLGTRDNFHATPALLRSPNGDLALAKDGIWHLFFNGNRPDDVEHATSRDGLKWEKDGRNPIYRQAYAPNMLRLDNEYRMYYVHKPKGASWELHLATGPDIYSLKPHPFNPVLVISQPWETKHLCYPYVLRSGNQWVMFYVAYWNDGSGVQKTAIGAATSPDGIKWTKYVDNPVLTPIANSAYESVYNSSQSVIRDGDTYRLFYAGRIDLIHKYFSINLATKAAQD